MNTLTVVLPTLNEAANVGPLIASLRDVFADASPEFLVVDGPSTDGTAQAAQAAGARVIAEPGTYAVALVRGIRESATEWAMVLDADGSHRAQDAAKLWQAREGADLVVGSRYAPGGRSGGNWFRRFLSRVLAGLFAMVARLPARDVSSGFRLYRRSFFEGVSPRAKFFEIQPELLAIAVARGGRVKEVGIVYEPRKSGRSKARVIRYGLAFLGMLRRARKTARKQ
ncbi:MAG: glycosyltransferase [Planctomycetes bacterium]|nr:glycosyltransferase [Planctomycetota bacterium]